MHPPDSSSVDSSSGPAVRWLSKPWEKVVFALLVVGVAAALVAGWWEFWFLTDDAHITFRYVSNHRLGWGYTWNPPPFKPVEGYSNFLWMVLLDYIWRITGVDPPHSANVLSLIFSFGTLVVAFFAAVQLRLPPSWARLRPWVGLMVVASLVANRTFLTWTSSGLETALFVFCCAVWVLGALNLARGAGLKWMWVTAGSAAASMLTRPDGGLLTLATVALAVLRGWQASADRLRDAKTREGETGAQEPFHPSIRETLREWRQGLPWLVRLAPLLLVVVHLLWRRWFYGEWAPNTYYAKFVAPWPEGGVRYTLSFAMEFCLFAWLVPGVVLLGRWLSRREGKGFSIDRLKERLKPHLPGLLVGAPFVVHVAYYTLVIGGDHFEYRVFAHLLLPMSLLLVVWVASLHRKPVVGLAVFGLVVALQQPVAWVHYAQTRTLNTRWETFKLTRPIAQLFPPGPFRAYVHGYDLLQAWMQQHHLGTRHQEHKVFFQTMIRDFPSREEGAKIPWEPDHPVFWGACVGGSSWRLPNTAIIDVLGLNDYVVARTPVRPLPAVRIIAHERSAPPGYLDCFQSNVAVADGKATLRPRPTPFTNQDIEACENRFRAQLPR